MVGLADGLSAAEMSRIPMASKAMLIEGSLGDLVDLDECTEPTVSVGGDNSRLSWRGRYTNVDDGCESCC